MGKIQIMNDTLINKIAAGEVVERICNVVKELVENSIDASSKNIKVELIDSGVKSIKVIDDGIGMSREDATLCFYRHATSKIKNENDLYFINTLGFRGEALAAISAVSNTTLDTFNGSESTLINIKAGKIISVKEGSKRNGTIIEVKELFYNTPARLKFLKSLQTELAWSVGFLEKIALSHPDISFEIINNNVSIFRTSGSGDLYKTIHEIFGINTTKNMIKISAENYDYIINGYVSNINISKSNKNNMITLVNGRVVTNQSVNRAIKDAYHTVLADNKYPIVIINIETDPTLIDVNIHPTKQDIKFSKLESLTDLLFTTIRSAINESDNSFKAYKEETYKPFEYKYKETSDNNDYEINPNLYNEVNEEKQEKQIEEVRLQFDVNEEEAVYNEETIKRPTTLIKPVGLALGTFLIAEDEDTMYMFDIHAADERHNYEIMLDKLSNSKVYTTNMLFPITLEYSHNEFMKIKERIDVIKDIGIGVEEFGTNTFRVFSHPTWFKEGHEDESIRAIFDLISEEKGEFDRVKFNDRVAASIACKSSVKANTRIGYDEQVNIIENLFKCKFPYTCPHGRPTCIKYPLYELEKMFKRVNFSKVNNE